MIRQAHHDTRGASLVEAVVAAGILAGVLTGILPLTTASWNGTAAARLDLLASQLARHRLQQLQTLTYLQLPAGQLRDVMTRLDGDGFATGGAGLTPTGLTALQMPVPGWSDWLDGQGAALPWSATPPPGARYRRQWAVLDDGSGVCVRVWVAVSALGAPVRPRPVEVGALQCAWGAATP